MTLDNKLQEALAHCSLDQLSKHDQVTVEVSVGYFIPKVWELGLVFHLSVCLSLWTRFDRCATWQVCHLYGRCVRCVSTSPDSLHDFISDAICVEGKAASSYKMSSMYLHKNEAFIILKFCPQYLHVSSMWFPVFTDRTFSAKFCSHDLIKMTRTHDTPIDASFDNTNTSTHNFIDARATPTLNDNSHSYAVQMFGSMCSDGSPSYPRILRDPIKFCMDNFMS